MAFICTLHVENQDGRVDGPREDGGFQVYKVDFEVELPYDVLNHRPIGNRRIHAVKVVYEKGPQSPLLLKTLCEGQNCPEIILRWYHIDEQGSEREYYTTTFKNAQIIFLKEWMPMAMSKTEEKDLGHLEEISIVAKEYSWHYLPKGIEYVEVPFK